MITGNRRTLGNVSEKTLSAMSNFLNLAVNDSRRIDYRNSESREYRLMTETNTEYRIFSLELFNHFDADSGFMRSSGSRRQNYMSRINFPDFFYCNFIGTDNLNLIIQFSEHLIKIISK